MKKITLQAYNIYELEQKYPAGFDKAYYKWLDSSPGWFCHQDHQELMQELQNLLDFDIVDYEYDTQHYYYKINIDNSQYQEIQGDQLKNLIEDLDLNITEDPQELEAKITGIYIDFTVMESLHYLYYVSDLEGKTFYQFLTYILDNAFNSFVKDYEYHTSREYFKEDSAINEEYYLDSGYLIQQL